jgi:hypothetical protein
MMFTKFSCTTLLVPIVLLFQAILLAFDLVLLTAGGGSIETMTTCRGYRIITSSVWVTSKGTLKSIQMKRELTIH